MRYINAIQPTYDTMTTGPGIGMTPPVPRHSSLDLGSLVSVLGGPPELLLRIDVLLITAAPSAESVVGHKVIEAAGGLRATQSSLGEQNDRIRVGDGTTKYCENYFAHILRRAPDQPLPFSALSFCI